LYLFLVEQYPDDNKIQNKGEISNKDSIDMNDYIIEAEDAIRRWKNNIPQRLQARGTLEACNALRKIIRELPECREQLQPRLLEAKSLARRNTWKPPKPEEFLQKIIIQEPSNSELSNQLETIDRRAEQMADEPKIDQSVHITGSKFRGDINTGNNNHLGQSDSETEGGFDWKYWLTIGVTITVALISVAASGVFNDDIRKWLNPAKPSPQTNKN
jgi:hypothetical protein